MQRFLLMVGALPIPTLTLFTNESWNTNKMFLSMCKAFSFLYNLRWPFLYRFIVSSSHLRGQRFLPVAVLSTCRGHQLVSSERSGGTRVLPAASKCTFNRLTRKRTKRERHLMTSSSLDDVVAFTFSQRYKLEEYKMYSSISTVTSFCMRDKYKRINVQRKDNAFMV